MTLDSPGRPLAQCPLCHTSATSATLSAQALAAGELWRCVTCGQTWTAQRLETVAAYEAWATNRAKGSI
jgi:transcription elongation factor Elf1